MRALALALASGLLLSACAPQTGDGRDDAPPPAQGRVADVDTPELRRLKATTDIPPCEPGPGAPVDGGLPDLTLPCLGGGEDVNLASLRGPMVVNLWATWCSPCRKELPVYERFHQQYGDRVDIVGIDFNDQHPAAALEMARTSGTSYPQLADPGTRLVGPLLAPSDGLPIHLFIDGEGRLVHRQAVEITSVEQLEGLVTRHLEVEL